MLVSTVDGAVDCQPIVYERCYTGEALDADGICVSERWRKSGLICRSYRESLFSAVQPAHEFSDLLVFWWVLARQNVSYTV